MANQNYANNKDNGVNLVDLFFYLLSYWYVFAICIILCVGYMGYKYAKSTFVFRSNATVIIKDPSKNRSAARLDNYNNLINKNEMSNEILQFKSRHVMTEVVNRLDAEVDYKLPVKLRKVELYRNTPVRLVVDDALREKSFALTVVPLDASTLKLKLAEGNRTVALNDTVATSMGTLRFAPTSAYDESWYGKDIEVIKHTPDAAARGLLSRLQIFQASDNASILNFSLMDYSRERAIDVLNMLFVVYNEESILEKNQVAINTRTFIDERLQVIGAELGNV